MLTVKELAERMGYTKQNITRMVRQGKIKATRRGRQYFFSKDVIDKIVKGEQTPETLT